MAVLVASLEARLCDATARAAAATTAAELAAAHAAAAQAAVTEQVGGDAHMYCLLYEGKARVCCCMKAAHIHVSCRACADLLLVRPAAHMTALPCCLSLPLCCLPGCHTACSSRARPGHLASTGTGSSGAAGGLPAHSTGTPVSAPPAPAPPHTHRPRALGQLLPTLHRESHTHSIK